MCASDGLSMEKLLCSNHCDGPSSSGCVAREKLTRSLEVHFGFKAFRQGAVLPVAHGKDSAPGSGSAYPIMIFMTGGAIFLW